MRPAYQTYPELSSDQKELFYEKVVTDNLFMKEIEELNTKIFSNAQEC
jgi:hypothetical protein